jgi:uncharacterized protein (DUF1697 family)
MALVVLLRGVNVGGHRTFRPSALAQQLKHLGAINIGAAGTFVVRHPMTPAQLRAEVARRLPFDAVTVVCQGRDISKLVSNNYFADSGSVDRKHAGPRRWRPGLPRKCRQPPSRELPSEARAR